MEIYVLSSNSTLAATVAVSNIACNGGTVTAVVTATGGTAPYTYSINGAAAVNSGSFANLVAGDYNVLVTDANGCTYYVAFTIDQPTALLAEIITNNEVSCYGGNDGSATVNATGGTTPYTYAWPATASSQTTATATGLVAGTYIVTVTDANSCTTTASVTITEPTNALDITTTAAVVTNASCNGSSNGAINITV